MRFLFVPLMLCILTAASLGQEVSAKLEVPAEAAQTKSLAIVKETYKSDFDQAKTSVQKLALAKKLLQEGIATKDDPGGRFVLLSLARDLALQQSDAKMASDAINDIAADYNIDQPKMQIEAASTAAKALKLPQQQQHFVAAIIPWIDEAIARDQLDLAKDLTALALETAQLARVTEHIKLLDAKAKYIEQLAQWNAKAKEARSILKTRPNDPQANLALGEYLCFVKDDWSNGIPLLSLGSDTSLKSVAVLEQEQQPNSLKLGDGWWQISETQEDWLQAHVQTHAAQWYVKALPSLSGLTKARVENRLKQFPLVTSGNQPDSNDKPLERAAPQPNSSPAVKQPAVVEKSPAPVVKAPEPKAVQVKEGPKIYLATIKPSEATDLFVVGTLGYEVEKGGHGSDVVVKGTKYDKALSMRPPSEGATSATFRLDKQFNSFHTTAAIVDHKFTARLVDCEFFVFGDGKELWKATIGKGGEKSVDLDVSGVKFLRLEVHCLGANDRAFAVWCDPYLQ